MCFHCFGKMNLKIQNKNCSLINLHVNNTPPPEDWIKSQNCKHLTNKRKEANKSFERKKNLSIMWNKYCKPR